MQFCILVWFYLFFCLPVFFAFYSANSGHVWFPPGFGRKENLLVGNIFLPFPAGYRTVGGFFCNHRLPTYTWTPPFPAVTYCATTTTGRIALALLPSPHLYGYAVHTLYHPLLTYYLCYGAVILEFCYYFHGAQLFPIPAYLPCHAFYSNAMRNCGSTTFYLPRLACHACTADKTPACRAYKTYLHIYSYTTHTETYT